MSVKTEPTTAYSGEMSLRCVYLVGGYPCFRPAPWVPTRYADDDGMLAGWKGQAWCNEHRPSELDESGEVVES